MTNSVGNNVKTAGFAVFGSIFVLSYWLSVPLGIYVTIEEWGRDGLLNFLNIILCFIPFGGFFNWIAHIL